MRKQKWIAGILVVVMVLSLGYYGPYAVTDAATAESIPNNNMNTTTGSWTRYIDNTTWKQDADETISTNNVSAKLEALGDYAAQVTKECKGDMWLRSAAITMKDGETYYQIGGQVKTSNASGKTNIYLQVRYVYENTSKTTTIAALYGGSDGAYKELSGYFRADAKAKEMNLIFCMSDQQDGIYDADNQTIMYVDDTFITAMDEPAVNTEFESTDGLWEEYLKRYGYVALADEFSFDVSNEEAYSGDSSLHIQKNSYSTESYIAGGGRLTDLSKENILCTDEMSYTWGMYVKSKNSSAFVRMDIDVYNSANEFLGTVKGRETMLSRSDKEGTWTRISTTAKLPDGIDAGTYMVYRIVVTSGTADFYVDSLFGKITETYYEKIVDWSVFQAAAEWNNATVSEGVGSVSGGMMSRRVDTMIPGASYEVLGKYSASTVGTIQIDFYDIEDKKITHTQAVSEQGSASTEKQSLCTFMVPEGTVYAEISFGGAGDYTLSEYVLSETKGRVVEGSWQGEWVWYPENVLTDGQNATRYFQKTFNVSSLSTVEGAFLQIAADDSIGSIQVNGNAVTTHHSDSTYGSSPYTESGKRAVSVYNITSYLKEGDNTLDVTVTNISSHGGLLYEIEIYKNDGSGTVRYVSDGTTLASKDKVDWSSARRLGSPEYGSLSNVTYWRRVVNNDASILAINHGFMDETLSGVAGETITKISTEVQALTNAEKEAYDGYTFTGRLYNTSDKLYYAVVPVTMKVGAKNTEAEFSIQLPDYVPAGSYELRMDSDEIRLLWNGSNKLCTLQVTAPTEINLTKAAVTESGKLTVNDSQVSPILYLRPNMNGLYDYDKLSAFQDSGVELYATYNGYLSGYDYAYKIYSYETDGDDATDPSEYVLWTGNDAEGNPQLNYKWFDYEIMRTLDLNANENTKVLVNVCVDAPDWWAEAHLDTDCVKYMDANGNTELLVTRPDEAALTSYQVSMASEAYQTDVQKVIKQLVQHMTEASYAERVIGVRFVAGRTHEWMQYGVGSGQVVDYSTATLEAFRTWLTEKYSTDATLQTAWNDSNVTLATAAIPTSAERNPSIDTAILDSSSHQKVIDYNTFLGEAGAEYMVACAQAAKSVNADWLAGAYNGYSWNFTSSEGIGSAHTASSIVLESEYVDFIASPMNYGERVDGYATGHMALSDSVTAAGKLYMVEMDNRTLHAQIGSDSPTSLGKEDTVTDTLQQLTRDMSLNFVRGTGMWFYDMDGGWFEDDSIEAQIATLKAEFDKQLDNTTNNEVAVFVAEDNYNHLVADIVGSDTGRTTYLLSSLYSEQRRELSTMGASYDIFSVNDVLKGKVQKDYKLNIVLSPFELTDQECETLKTSLAKNGQVVLWIYMSGISDGTSNAEANVERLVDMDITLHNETHALQAKTVAAEGEILLKGAIKYGNWNAKTGPWAAITNGTPLATYTSGETAAAYVEKEDYTSVYSAVSGVPAEMLRALCEKAGVHIYSDDMSDIVETNGSYIAIHCVSGGEKTIALTEQQAKGQVYDVLEETYVDIVDGSFTYTHTVGETKLYRLEAERSEETVTGEMTWTDTTEDPDNSNLFYNGTFDKADGSYNIGGWHTANPSPALDAAGSVEQSVESENLVKASSLFDNASVSTSLTSLHAWNLNSSNVASTQLAIEAFEDRGNVLKFTKEAKASQYITYYGITLEADTTYHVTFDAKSPDGVSLQFYYDKGGGSAFADSVKTKTLGNDWFTYDITFTTGENTMQTAYFNLYDTTQSGVVYVDDLCITKITVENSGYTEGYGTFGEADNALMVETKTEFWNYGTSVKEGKTYRYSMNVKVEDAGSDFSFQPYLYDFVNKKTTYLTELKLTANCDWLTISCQFTAPAVDETNGVRFGFTRSGTGRVYLDDIELTEVGSANPVPEQDSFVPNGSTLSGWNGATEISCFAAPDGGLGVGAKGTEISTVFKEGKQLQAGCEYVLQFRADVTNVSNITVKIGNAVLSPKESIAEENGWKDFVCVFTPTASSNQSITFMAEGGEISLDDVSLYQKYQLGDANGDGELDARDLVRYKKNLKGDSLATYVFTDFDGTRDGVGYDKTGVVVDEKDIAAYRKYLVMRQKLKDIAINGDFSDDNLQLGVVWGLEGGETPVITDGSLAITRANSTNTYVKYTSATPIFEIGKTYTVSYRAKSTGDVKWRNTLIEVLDNNNWQVNGKDYSASDWTDYSFTFTATKASNWPVIGFQLVSGEGTVYVDDFRIQYEVGANDEGNYFVPNTFWDWLDTK